MKACRVVGGLTSITPFSLSSTLHGIAATTGLSASCRQRSAQLRARQALGGFRFSGRGVHGGIREEASRLCAPQASSRNAGIRAFCRQQTTRTPRLS